MGGWTVMNSHLTEIAEEIERIGHNANVTTRHLDYYLGGAGRNEDAEELAKYVLQHLTSIIDGLHIAAKLDSTQSLAGDV